MFGYSDGAMVAQLWMAEHAGDPAAPSPEQLSFVLIGNPKQPYGGISPADPQTQYHVIDIVRQYDPVADFPDHPFNLLALANVAAGALSPIHLDYTGVILDDPANVVWTVGNTTYVFVPTENLPLLAPLRMLGMNELADALNEPLKEIVERAYDRPYLTPVEPVAPPEDTTATPLSANTTATATDTKTTPPTVTASTTAVADVARATEDDTTARPLRRRHALKESVAAADSTDDDTAPQDHPPAQQPSASATDGSDTAQQAASDSPATATSANSGASKTATHIRWGRHRRE